MDKSVGTVAQLERFLTHAKLYPRATNTPRPYPLPPPHGQNRQGTIPLIFQHSLVPRVLSYPPYGASERERSFAFNIVLGGKGGGDMDL